MITNRQVSPARDSTNHNTANPTTVPASTGLVFKCYDLWASLLSDTFHALIPMGVGRMLADRFRGLIEGGGLGRGRCGCNLKLLMLSDSTLGLGHKLWRAIYEGPNRSRDGDQCTLKRWRFGKIVAETRWKVSVIDRLKLSWAYFKLDWFNLIKLCRLSHTE